MKKGFTSAKLGAATLLALATALFASCGGSAKQDVKGKVRYLNFKPESAAVYQELADIYEKGGFNNVFVAQIAPKALFEWGWAKLCAGVVLSPASDIQWIYPDVRLTADLLDNALQAYAFVKGGQLAWNYADLKLDDHWFGAGYTNVLKPTLERLNFALGARGSAMKYLQYDVRGGWASRHYKDCLEV